MLVYPEVTYLNKTYPAEGGEGGQGGPGAGEEGSV